MAKSSRSSVSPKTSFLLVLILLTAASANAWAKKRVVITKFEGTGAAAVQVAVEDVVQREHILVSETAVSLSLKKLKIKKLNDEGVARLAADVSADAVVTGVVRPARGGAKLTLVVRDGRLGNIAASLDIALASTKEIIEEDRKQILTQLMPVLERVGRSAGEDLPVMAQPTIAPEPAPPTPAPIAPVPAPVVVAAPASAPAADPSFPPGSELATARHYRHAAAEVSLGLEGVKRDLSFNYASDLSNSQKPNSYSGAFVPALVVSGELYPLAFSDPAAALSGLGVSFVVDKVLVIKSKLGAGTLEYPTSQMRWGLGARYRWNFGDSATDPSVKFLFGYNHLDFTIDRGMDNIDLPNVSYSYLDMGAEGRLPLMASFALFADIKYLLILGTGEISTAESYGKGSVSGLDMGAGLELRFLERAVAKVGFKYQRIAYAFDGSGDRANNLDGDPSTPDVGGALDSYLAGYLSFGYTF